MIGLLISSFTLLAVAPFNLESNAKSFSDSAAREWTNASHTQQVRATLVRVEGSNLWLRRPNGALATVAMSQLSSRDRQYVASRAPTSGSESGSLIADLANQFVFKVGSGARTIAKLPHWSQTVLANGRSGLIPAAIIYVRVSRNFLEDYVEHEVSRTKPVHDFVLGTRIVGDSNTHGKTRLELLPNSSRLSGKITFEGTVHARTQGYNGPVVLHQTADSTFQVSKTITLDGSGLQTAPTVAVAPTQLTTTSIESTLPRLRGRIATRIARRREGESHRQAQDITAQHTAAIIGHDFDESTNASLAKLEQVLRSKVPDINREDGPMMAELRFCTNQDNIEIAMVRANAAGRERELRPPSVAGNPDIAVRVHRVMLTRAITDPEMRDELGPLLSKLLSGQLNGKKLVAAGKQVAQTADNTKWAIDRDWLTLDFTDVSSFH